MKQTNQFQLNLIEATDPFEVAPINENTQTLEDALVAHGQAADAHGDIRTALSGHANSKVNPHGVTAAQVGAAAEAHNHSAANITSGTLPVARGGTGNTSVDTTPTASSTKMVTSGGVYTALSKKADSEHTHNYAAATHTHSGYAAADHTHSNYAATNHTHSTYYDSNTSRTANTVLAAPNGAAGAATFRNLVSADIPNLPVSKITSGTLPVARGGTGNTSVDTTPTADSTKMVTSGGVYTALAGKADSTHTHSYAATSHNHAASNITSGTLAVTRGGTGVTSLTNLLKAMFPSTADATFLPVFGSSWGSAGYTTPRTLRNAMGLGDTTSALPVANGGTGNTSADTAPTSGSTKMVTSGGVYTALAGKAGTGVATTSANGLMSSTDKSKLDGIATGANKTTVDSALSSSSTNPVQNKVVNSALAGKATTATYEATVTASWTASGNYYYQNITVTGITANDNPIVGIKTGTDNDANKLYHESLGKVIRIVTAANKITVYATEKISTAFPIQLKVVR